MCMADIYSHAGEEYAVAHCNFHLRGIESDADAALVERWAFEHGVQFFKADFDTAAYSRERGISIEMAARELRYAWFGEVARTHGFDAVAVAHNANDNAETLVLNLLRGTGSRGLRGISRMSCLPCPEGVVSPANLCHPRQHKREGPPDKADSQHKIALIRPLWGMTRGEIEAYAAEHRIEYREDRTNAEVEYKRNRIRNVVFPEFEKINPSFVKTLNEDMERFAQVDEIAEDYFQQARESVCDACGIDVRKLLALKHWRYVTFRVLDSFGFGSGVVGEVTALLQALADGEDITFAGKRFMGGGYVALTTSGRIDFLPRGASPAASESMTVEGEGIYEFDGVRIKVERVQLAQGESLVQREGVLLCDGRALAFPFLLRHWRSGDWMRPFGMGGRSKKLSDIFTDLKYSLREKECAVVVVSPALAAADEGHVAALAGVRMDEALRIAEGSTNPHIRISIL